MWVFGYGSLMWKADFPYEKTVIGYIKGYVRRFYQKSTDHRGVPDRPGRVVTLLPSVNPEDEVWGVAYKISLEDVDGVTSHLDFREKGGYRRKHVLFHPHSSVHGSSMDAISDEDPRGVSSNNSSSDSDDNPFYITIYIGEEDNPNYAGVEDLETIAKQILISHGPSGPNIEYLYKLADAMRKIAPHVHDDHLFALEAAVKRLQENLDKENESDKCIPEPRYS